MQASARSPSTLTTQEGVRAWTWRVMDVEFILSQDRPDLEGMSWLHSNALLQKKTLICFRSLASKEPSKHHSWKARGSLRCRSNSRWPGHSARCTEGNMKLHRVDGGQLYLGALHFWVPDKQLHVRVFISHLTRRRSLFCSEENTN